VAQSAGGLVDGAARQPEPVLEVDEEIEDVVGREVWGVLVGEV
jgi:hypothetical protein